MGENFSDAAAEFPEPYRLFVRESVASTNDDVRELALMGAQDGVIVLAEQQTAGRGRRGATWFSTAGEGLAFSILVKPQEPKAVWSRLALAAGLAVAEALESCGIEAGIKWPNDVWIGGKKVAGILVEAGADFAVVGIGLNINTLHFPAEVAQIATSLQLESGDPFSRSEVLGKIMRHFAIRRSQIESNFGEMLDAVRVRCVLTGKQVTLSSAHGAMTGTVEGIAATGELLLRTVSGLERLMQADEVRLIGH